METTKNVGKTFGAILLGTVIGGVIGMAFAPGKGSRTRRKILVKGEDLADAVKKKSGGAKNKAKEYINAGNSKPEKRKIH